MDSIPIVLENLKEGNKKILFFYKYIKLIVIFFQSTSSN